MSERYTTRSSTQTPSSIYLPLMMSRNIPAFVTTAIQRSRTTIEQEDLLISDFAGKEGSTQRRPDSPLPRSEYYEQVDDMPTYYASQRYQGDPSYYHPTSPQYTTASGDEASAHYRSTYPVANADASSDFYSFDTPRGSVAYHPGEITADFKRVPYASTPYYNTLPGNSSVGRQSTNNRSDFRHLPRANVNFVTLPGASSVNQSSFQTIPQGSNLRRTDQISSNFRRVPIASTPQNFQTIPHYNSVRTGGPVDYRSSIPHGSNVEGTDQMSSDFRRVPLSSTAQNFQTIPHYSSVRKGDPIDYRSSIPYGSNLEGTDQISSDFRRVPLSSTAQNFQTIPCSSSVRTRYPVDYRSPILHESNLEETNQISSDFRRVPLSSTTQNFQTLPYDRSSIPAAQETYYTPPGDYIERGTSMDTGEGTFLDFASAPNNTTIRRNYPYANALVDRGVSALELPQQVPRFPRRPKVCSTPPHLSAVPEEISHGTQSPQVPYLTRLSKHYRDHGKDLDFMSPISNQQLNVRATQSPSCLGVENDNISMDSQLSPYVQETYRCQPIATDAHKPCTSRACTLRKLPTARELDKNYVARRLPPPVLNRTHSIPVGRVQQPLPTTRLVRNRTMSSPQTLNRTYVALPYVTAPARIYKPPGAIERKREDLLGNRRMYTNPPVEQPRRASTLDISSYLNEVEPADVPLYKSYSDSSIDMTDESTCLPVPPKKMPAANRRCFTPLPKVHEEPAGDSEYSSGCYNDLDNRMIMNEMDTAPHATPATGSVPRKTSAPLRNIPSCGEYWEVGVPTPGFTARDFETDPMQKWTNVGKKDSDEKIRKFADSVIESLSQNKDTKPASDEYEEDPPGITNSTGMIDDSLQSESRSDTASQIMCNTKTKGVQVMGSKMRVLDKSRREKSKRRKTLEEMYQCINQDILH